MNALLYVDDTYNSKLHETLIILQILSCIFRADIASGEAWRWSRTSNQYRGYESVELYIHSPSTPSCHEYVHLHLLEPEDTLPCDILASHSGVGEDSSLLGCYATWIGKEPPTFRRIPAFFKTNLHYVKFPSILMFRQLHQNKHRCYLLPKIPGKELQWVFKKMTLEKTRGRIPEKGKWGGLF
jgi:hypothetical protein